jgi:hypothetical protein
MVSKNNISYPKFLHQGGKIKLDSNFNYSALFFHEPTTVFSEGFLDITNMEQLAINLTARSVGSVLSHVYLAIKCFTEPDDNCEISCVMGELALTSAIPIKSYTENSFELNTNEPQWDNIHEKFNDNKCSSACLAIYYNDSDEFERIPDHIIFPVRGSEKGKFEILYEINHDGKVILNTKLPDKVLSNMATGQCYLRLHTQAGGGWLYPKGNFSVPHQAQTYKCLLSTKGKFNSKNNLRAGTKYIKIGLLTNYNQRNLDAQLLVTDFFAYELLGNNV